MTCLLASTAVTCSECHKPLSGGKDTFGPYDFPICLDCKFLVDERGYLRIEEKEIDDDIKKLADLRKEFDDLDEAIDNHHAEITDLENRFDRDEARKVKITEEELELLLKYGLLPGEEITKKC